MNPGTPLPRILLVEDDPTTCTYLQALLQTLPAEPLAAASMAEALRLAGEGAIDLLLVDARLPDGSGPELLARLRSEGVGSPAVAHTAARDPDALQPLLEAGFLEVLCKPVDPGTWRATLRRHLGLAGGRAPAVRIAEAAPPDAPPLWDDAVAARALAGNTVHIASLRDLFMAELPGQLDALGADGAAASDILHRLRASCALVGAARLEAAVKAAGSPPGKAAIDAITGIGRQMLGQGHPSSSASAG